MTSWFPLGPFHLCSFCLLPPHCFLSVSAGAELPVSAHCPLTTFFSLFSSFPFSLCGSSMFICFFLYSHALSQGRMRGTWSKQKSIWWKRKMKVQRLGHWKLNWCLSLPGTAAFRPTRSNKVLDMSTFQPGLEHTHNVWDWHYWKYMHTLTLLYCLAWLLG